MADVPDTTHIDFKPQVNRGNKNPDKWDQRKSTGAFQGKPDLYVSTIKGMEFRLEGDAADALINPARLKEFIHEGDNALQVVNRIFAAATANQPSSFGFLASLLGLEGSGPVDVDIYAYDN